MGAAGIDADADGRRSGVGGSILTCVVVAWARAGPARTVLPLAAESVRACVCGAPAAGACVVLAQVLLVLATPTDADAAAANGDRAARKSKGSMRAFPAVKGEALAAIAGETVCENGEVARGLPVGMGTGAEVGDGTWTHAAGVGSIASLFTFGGLHELD